MRGTYNKEEEQEEESS